MASGVSTLGGGETILVPCGPVSSTTCVGAAMFMAIRHRGHNPDGELAGSGVPHCGQAGFESVLMPVPYPLAIVCYTWSENLKPGPRLPPDGAARPPNLQHQARCEQFPRDTPRETACATDARPPGLRLG